MSAARETFNDRELVHITTVGAAVGDMSLVCRGAGGMEEKKKKEEKRNRVP